MAHLQVDVCVIGNELSGFATAALLAHRGHRVVLIEDQDAYETKMLGDFFAPTFPFVWQAPKSGTVATLFEDLGLKAELRQSLKLNGRLGFVNDPHERLIADGDIAELRKELKRAFGEGATSMLWGLENFEPQARDALFNEAVLLSDTGFWANIQTKKRVAKAGKIATLQGSTRAAKSLCQSPLGEYLGALLPYLHYQSVLDLDSIGGHLALKALTGATLMPQLMHASPYAVLKSMIAESFLRRGGEILQQSTIEQIQTHKNAIQTIHLKGKNSYTPAFVIDATYARRLPAFLDNKELAAQLKDREDQVKPVGQTYIARWLLPRCHIPAALPSVTLSFKRDEAEESALLGLFTPWRKPSLHLSMESQFESEHMVAVMATWREQPNSGLARAQMERHAERLMPFALENAITSDFWDKEEANAIGPRYLGYGKGLNPLGGRPLQTPLSNLLRAARDVAPGLGIDGELCVAIATANATSRALLKPHRSLFGLKNSPMQKPR